MYYIYIERAVVRPRTISIQRIAEVPLTPESEAIRALAPIGIITLSYHLSGGFLFQRRMTSLKLDFIGKVSNYNYWIVSFIYIKHVSYTRLYLFKFLF